jgi:hypothetical protein
MNKPPLSGPSLSVSVSRSVAASPERVYDVLSDVSRMGELSPETVRAQWTDESDVARVGATFRGSNRIGLLRWSTVPVVTRAEPGRAFGFDVPAPSRTSWLFELEPSPGGCRVTESMHRDGAQPMPIRVLQRLAGVTDRAEHLRAGMTATLERLAAVSESAASDRV